MSDATPRPAWRESLLALAASFLWLAATAWVRPLLLPDEGRYATVAWEMLRSGNWLTPMLDGLPFFHKPPLFYWITGAAMSLIGPNQFSARLASLLGAALGAFALYLFTRRWSDDAAARRALIVLLVQPLFFVSAQFANLDMLVAGCITATVLALAHAALCFEQGQPYRRALWLAYALAALGVLSKGLIGIVIPAMVVGLWLALRWRWRSVAALVSPPGLALFLLIAAPWFIAMQRHFDGFLHYFFVVQHFRRFTAGSFNNVQPFWFYPVVLAAGCLPGVLWLRGVFARGYFSAATPRGAIRLLMALAVVCVLLFFSLPQSKLVGYILPAVPPLAWLIADASALASESAAHRRWWRPTLAVSALLGLAVVAGLTLDKNHSTRGLGLALRARRQPGEPVYMYRHYLYDVPFYARLREPVIVVDDWNKPSLTQRDSWRKELADSAAFDPAQARQLLLPEALPAALCRGGVAWVMASSVQRDVPAFLAQAQPVQTARGVTLWRVDGRAMHCQGITHAGPSDISPPRAGRQ